MRSSSDVDVGLVFSTDGRLAAFDFRVLRDDRGFFPSYRLTPVVRQQTLDRRPEIALYLNALSAKLDNATMARLNGKVDLEGRPVEEVAASFLSVSEVGPQRVDGIVSSEDRPRWGGLGPGE